MEKDGVQRIKNIVLHNLQTVLGTLTEQFHDGSEPLQYFVLLPLTHIKSILYPKLIGICRLNTQEAVLKGDFEESVTENVRLHLCICGI